MMKYFIINFLCVCVSRFSSKYQSNSMTGIVKLVEINQTQQTHRLEDDENQNKLSSFHQLKLKQSLPPPVHDLKQ